MMKKILLLLFIVIPMVAVAQKGNRPATAQSSQHITFLGIPLTGSLNDFRTKLKTKGYEDGIYSNGQIVRYQDKQSSTWYMAGLFTNEPCTFCISHNKRLDEVYSIAAIYVQKYSTWSSVKSLYDNLKENLKAKYVLDKEEEKFPPMIDVSLIENNLILLRSADFKYCSTFQADGGTIVLTLYLNEDSTTASVMIHYMDTAGCLDYSNSIQGDL